MTKPPIVDAEVLREFFEKAETFLTESYLDALARGLRSRTHEAPRLLANWETLWNLAPAGRRVPDKERSWWQPRLEPLLVPMARGESQVIVEGLEKYDERPSWLLDWATFWCHVSVPESTWWARWVYGMQSRTGSLALIVQDATALTVAEDRVTVYQAIDQAFQFLGSVLDNTHQLDPIDAPYRPIVAAAVVYGVYMFTMASWKMTEEFTKVLPPFPVVVKTLLGLNRWEGNYSGPKSHAN